MSLDTLISSMFPEGADLNIEGSFFSGVGSVEGEVVQIIGTLDAAPIGVELALNIAAEVLSVIRLHPGRSIVLMVDTSGQRLSRRDELLGINHYLSHVAKCIEQARLHGHRMISLVYSLAISGGYLSTGMLADASFALPAAEIRVMGLPAMSRVTKIPLERLEALSKDSPVFAPGVENFFAMGALNSLWNEPLHEHLIESLKAPEQVESRREVAHQRGGRRLAKTVSERVRTDALS